MSNNNNLKNKQLFQFSGYLYNSYNRTCIHTINFYNKNGIILSLDPRRVNLKTFRYDKSITYYEHDLDGVYLLNNPITKNKEAFNIKNNYIIKNKKDSDKYNTCYDLYINIDIEKITIEQLETTKKEMSYKYYHHYNNYKITGLHCLYTHSYIYYAKEEHTTKIKDFDKAFWGNKVDFLEKEIKKYEKFLEESDKNTDRYNRIENNKNKYKELLNKGYKYKVLKYISSITDELQPAIYSHATTDPELKTLKDNILLLKDLVKGYNEKDILNQFKKLGLDLESINLQELLNK